MSLQTSLLNKIEYLPLEQIRRPIPPVLDHSKIDAMVSTLTGTPAASATCTLAEASELKGELPPVDVMKVRENGKTYYFAFGGCHRFQAYDRLGGKKLVKCKIIPATKKQIKLYTGASVDAMFD
ncbi:sulfiredoxin [Saccharomycopsis crataegensis]|uniref:Sulfiredoxin n=1 Tax=Saccharomycopsis crataegensis TaxID=43959 RepID=A0AAV5QFC9_9ASCO|nr:sulfiredoxin [Saccharomycopsis crataegensis]